VVDEHPPTFVEYDEATTVVKQYTQCPEKASECVMNNVSSLTMKNTIQ
jgi:hypothetical protein